MNTEAVIVFVCIFAAGAFIFGHNIKRKKAEDAANFRALSMVLMDIERKLALLNPRIGRGQPLEPEEQEWLDEQVASGIVTANRSYWASPDLGYNAFDGTRGEVILQYLNKGGHKITESEAEELRVERIERMVAEIGMPKTQAQIDRWHNAHSFNPKKRIPRDPIPPSQIIYHGMVKGFDPAIVLIYEMNDD